MLFKSSLTVVCLFALAVEARAVEIPPEHHPWGRLQPGSWSRVRVVTETFGGGKSSSEISIITTTLVRVEEDGVVLTREAKTGDEVTREENVKYAWDGTRSDPNTQEKYSLGEVDVDGKTYACQTHIRTTKDEVADREVKSWYSPDQSPYFLKRLTRVTGESPETTSMRVIRLAVTQTVLDKPLVCWQSETKFSSASDKATTTGYYSIEIPGGLVSSDSEVIHPQQGTKQRLRQELIEYEVIR
ncbi:MAG: hypothetical protein O3C40_26395 [Planctomycetota bacterium]|nr:hypothetical protein [Planctomycetota bacterium]